MMTGACRRTHCWPVYIGSTTSRLAACGKRGGWLALGGCSSRTIVLELRPLTVRELAISTANCHSCVEQNCNNLRTKTLMSTDCR
jgi:hypothetical protein